MATDCEDLQPCEWEVLPLEDDREHVRFLRGTRHMDASTSIAARRY